MEGRRGKEKKIQGAVIEGSVWFGRSFTVYNLHNLEVKLNVLPLPKTIDIDPKTSLTQQSC